MTRKNIKYSRVTGEIIQYEGYKIGDTFPVENIGISKLVKIVTIPPSQIWALLHIINKEGLKISETMRDITDGRRK